MAVLASIATGNFTSAATWGVVDSTSFGGTVQNTGNAFPTTYSATSRTVSFTPGAITVSHIGFKLATRTGTTGTLTLHIADTTHVEIAGTAVTINCADLPEAAVAGLNGGWHFLKLASPVTLLAATAYEVEGKVSNANQITPHSASGSAQNFSVALITTTTQAPAAGDDLIIAGEYTGAGTSNSFTVTMDETATTDYGSAPTTAISLITPGIAICNKGTLNWGTTAATNYNLKLSNSLIIYSGGVINMGTTGTPCPRDSSMTLQFDPSTNVDYGFIVRNLGTFNAQGLSRTSGKDIWYCKLNTDEAIASTSLGVDTDTGWLDNDEIAIASTTQTPSNAEAGALNGDAGASSLTVDGFLGAGGGLAAAHSGTSPTQAEVILLTRNVIIRGASATLQGYIAFEATSTVDIDWTEFKWLGSATANKRGINLNTTTGSCNIHYSSIHDFRVASSVGILPASGAGGYTISNCCFWNTANSAIGMGGTSTLTNWVIDSNIAIRNTDNTANLFNLLDIGGTFTNNTATGAAGSNSHGIVLNENGGTVGTFSGNTVHSNLGQGINFGAMVLNSTLSNCIVWRNSTGVYIQSGSINTIIDSFTLFGNNSTSLQIFANSADVTFLNIVSNGDTTFPTTFGFTCNGTNSVQCNICFINCDFSTVGGIKTAHTADITAGSNYARIKVINSKLGGSSTQVFNPNLLHGDSVISSQKNNQTTGTHKSWKKYGTLEISTTQAQADTKSLKMTPTNASNKLTSSGHFGGFKVPVLNGQTCTPSVYVFEDATYNGARARLILKRNDAIGISADTVLDTATAASDLAWEALTGTTAAATDDGTMEFVIDCDGTAGNLYVDTFTATVA